MFNDGIEATLTNMSDIVSDIAVDSHFPLILLKSNNNPQISYIY